MQLAVSPYPLGIGSLNVEPIFTENNLASWSDREHAESYNLLENVATLWREKEQIDDFIVIGMVPPRMHSDRFSWEIIPFNKTSLTFFDQFLTLWRLTFNSLRLSKTSSQNLKKEYLPYHSLLQRTYKPISQVTPNLVDIFCQPDLISQLLLYEGNLVNLIYNCEPIAIGKEKLHFLIIPKRYCSGFSELTQEEYIESQNISSKVIQYYQNNGFPIVYLFHKTSPHQGQTIRRWHQHLIFAETATDEFLGKLLIIGKMIFDKNPLPKNELEELVNKYRKQVQEAMK